MFKYFYIKYSRLDAKENVFERYGIFTALLSSVNIVCYSGRIKFINVDNDDCYVFRVYFDCRAYGISAKSQS